MIRIAMCATGSVVLLLSSLACLKHPATAEEPKTGEKSKPEKTPASERKLSWKDLDTALGDVKSSYRPTQKDWDQGDEHLTRKLTSMVEEMKGRKVVEQIDIAIRLTSKRPAKIESFLSTHHTIRSIESLIQKLDVEPVASDRNCSWEKLHAMLKAVPNPDAVTESDWKKGDAEVIRRLRELRNRYDREVSAVMLRNAYLAASGGREDLETLYAATGTVAALDLIIKEVRGKDKR